MQRSNKGSNPKPPKTKLLHRKPPLLESQGNNVKGIEDAQQPLSLKKGQKASKRTLQNEVPNPISFQQPEISTSDSWPDSSNSGNEYRALRRKYLLLEEERFALGREFGEVEDEVKTLEDEKLALLDQLVVLEGLIDPSEFKSQGMNLPQAFIL